MGEPAVAASVSLHPLVGRLIAACAALVLGAVAVNFARAGRGGSVAAERRSPVATLTMVLFFLGFSWLVQHRLGAWTSLSSGTTIALTAVGLPLVIAGCAVNLLGRWTLGRNWANQVVVYDDHVLVTGGVYGWLRHPLYASLIWMFCGAGLAYANWAALLATFLIFVPAMHYRADQEEEVLAARFPDYAAYRARTGKFVPRRGLPRPPDMARIPRDAFRFCRYTVALLMWLGVLWRQPAPIVLVWLIMAVSAALSVRRSPLLWFYTRTLHRVVPSPYEELSVPAMRFSHTLATVFIGLGLLLLAGGSTATAWRWLGIMAIFKTISALSGCPASKIYTCVTSGGACCAFLTRPGRRR
jgi:protein-S-isoprenylcysteine O-methyltransferase Ste14